MSEWPNVLFGDVLSVRYGKDHKSLGEGLFPCFGSGGVMRWVDKHISIGPSVLIPRKGSLSNIFFVAQPFWTVDTVFWTEIHRDLADPRFVFYKALTIDWESMNVGSAVPSLTSKVITGESIQLPPLHEQEAIAEVLSSLDDKIDLLGRQNKTLEGMAEALFRQWFIEEAQDDWEEVSLNDVFEINPRYKISRGDLAPFVEMKNLQTENSAIDGWRYREFTSGSKFTNGDILIARITPCLENGKSGIVRQLPEGEIGWGSTEFIVFKMKHGLCPLLGFAIISSKEFKDLAVSSLAGSSGRQRAQVDVMAEFSFSVPSTNHLKQASAYLMDVEKRLALNEIELDTLKKQRNTLLPKLMSGEVRIGQSL
jgi:type I restriction enzyme S subunit